MQTIWGCLPAGDSGEELLSQIGLSLGELSLLKDAMEADTKVGGLGTSTDNSTSSRVAYLITPSTTPFRELKEAFPEDSDTSDRKDDEPFEEAPASEENVETDTSYSGESSGDRSSENESFEDKDPKNPIRLNSTQISTTK